MKRAGFAIRDVLVGVTVVGTLCVLAVPTLSQVRMDSARQACIGNYRFIAGSSASYENDHAGYMWALSWKRGMLYTGGLFPVYASSDIEAQAFQTIDILRRLSGYNASVLPLPSNWVSQILYTHAALMDYVNLPAPASFLVCPEDWVRQAFLDGDLRRLPWSESGPSTRLIFTSSYSASTYQWAPSRQSLGINPSTGAAAKTAMPYPTPTDISYWNFDGTLNVTDAWRPRLASDVRFPSNKVFMSDDYARHNGKPRYYAYQTAAQDLLFHDGSVRYYRTDSTNPGWAPSSASSRGNMLLRFSHTKKADFWGGLDNGVSQAQFQAGWYRWTRGGLYGWDVPRLSSMVGKLPNSNTVENEVDTSPATGAW